MRGKQQFGSKTTDGSTSFWRVEAFLFSNRGRVAVLGCIAAKLGSKLEGNGPDSGIEVCRIVQKVLQQAKNPPAPTMGPPISTTFLRFGHRRKLILQSVSSTERKCSGSARMTSRCAACPDSLLAGRSTEQLHGGTDSEVREHENADVASPLCVDL